MRTSLLLLPVLVLAWLLIACGAEPSPSPEATVAAQFQALPATFSGMPGPGDPSIALGPQSVAGGWPTGRTQQLTLGHCGLASPLDFDGSLWDAVGGHDGTGRLINDDQAGDLINASDVVITLIDPRTAWLVTRHGAVVLLERHAGPRAYLLCN